MSSSQPDDQQHSSRPGMYFVDGSIVFFISVVRRSWIDWYSAVSQVGNVALVLMPDLAVSRGGGNAAPSRVDSWVPLTSSSSSSHSCVNSSNTSWSMASSPSKTSAALGSDP